MLSGLLVLLTGSRFPDLVVGGAIGVYVVKEAIEILSEAREARAGEECRDDDLAAAVEQRHLTEQRRVVNWRPAPRLPAPRRAAAPPYKGPTFAVGSSRRLIWPSRDDAEARAFSHIFPG